MGGRDRLVLSHQDSALSDFAVLPHAKHHLPHLPQIPLSTQLPIPPHTSPKLPSSCLLAKSKHLHSTSSNPLLPRVLVPQATICTWEGLQSKPLLSSPHLQGLSALLEIPPCVWAAGATQGLQSWEGAPSFQPLLSPTRGPSSPQPPPHLHACFTPAVSQM